MGKRTWIKTSLTLLLPLLLAAQGAGCMAARLLFEDAIAADSAAPPPVVTPKPEPYPLQWPAPFATLAESRYVVRLLSQQNYENAMAIYAGTMNFESRIRLPYPMRGEELAQLIRILALDCPEMFQCTTGNIYEAQYYQENGKIYRMDPAYQYTQEAYAAKRAAQDAAASAILSGTQGMSAYAAILYCHDTLLHKCEYLKQPEAGTTTAYGALVGGKAQCYGYSLAMLQLLRGLGIPGFILTGHTWEKETGAYTRAHHWIAAALDGAWYAIDPTHDDLGGQAIYHAHFCVSDQDMLRVSIRDEAFYGSLVRLPPCAGGQQDYYVKTDARVSPGEDASAAFARIVCYAFATGQTQAEMRFTDAAQYAKLKEALKSRETMGEAWDSLQAIEYKYSAFDRQQVVVVYFTADAP